MAEERFHNFFETYHFMNFFLLNKVVKEKKIHEMVSLEI